MEKLDPREIFDPNLRNLPKTKQIFKVTKESRSRSNTSSTGKDTTPLIFNTVDKETNNKLPLKFDLTNTQLHQFPTIS